jgi:hypothetical protein
MLEKFIINLFFVAWGFLMYKYYYHIRSAKSIGGAVSGFIRYRVIIPLKYLPDNPVDNKSRKRANIALYIFYILIGISFILSLFVKNNNTKQGSTQLLKYVYRDTIVKQTDSERAVINDSFHNALKDTSFQKRMIPEKE